MSVKWERLLINIPARFGARLVLRMDKYGCGAHEDYKTHKVDEDLGMAERTIAWIIEVQRYVQY